MINFIQNNSIKNAIVICLAIAVVGITILSVGFKRHKSNMEEAQISLSCNSIDCSMPVNDLSCLDHCISAAQNSIQTSIVNPGIMSLLFTVGLFLGLFFSLVLKLPNYQRFSKSRLRQLYDESIIAFFHQLGFWLTLFEKRDPSYSFAFALA
ncbi:MAG: hypothetical protein AAB729_04705 [Patescibacteria group bacterium]